MSSGFLLAEMLSEFLRKPYRQGDMKVTMDYLLKNLKIGEYRVMLKRNFDTACWIPPVGKRGSHSIYYGDRMLARVIDRFCKMEEIPDIPDKTVLAERAGIRLQAKREVEAAKKRKTPSTKPIRLGPADIFDEKLVWLKENLSPDKWDELGTWLVQAVSSYGRHEREHARNTSQDLKTTVRDLRILGIPFTFFNLFEDSRIEHISRQTMGVPFNWNMFEDMAEMSDPFGLFLRCIQLEGEPDTEALDCDEPFGKGGVKSVGHAAESIETYYQRACLCPTDAHLYPIIAEFLEEFKDDLPEPPPPPEKGEGGEEGGSAPGSSESGESSGSGSDSGVEERAGDLSTAAEAAEEGDSFFEEFDKDSDLIGGTDEEGKAAEDDAKAKLKGDDDKSPPPSGKGGKSQGIADSIEPQASGGRARPEDFLANKPGRMDATYAKRVDNLTTMLMRLFRTNSLPAVLEAQGKRMSGRHLARGELMFVHKKVFGGKGKRRYSIVYDCSGSMQGRPDREGKLFLLALNNLAKRGYLQGQLVLSGWVGSNPGWLSYPFPVSDEVIMSIHPGHSSEGLQDALKDNLMSITGMDDVFVYTDACICDAPIDRGFFANHRIWPVGLYVGDEKAAKEMARHFPQNILKGTIEEVVEAMLVRNRRTVS